MTTLDVPKGAAGPLPNLSDTLPNALLAAEISPVVPVVPLPQVTAPELPFQVGLATQ
jgi:hypothetical protein